MKKSKIFLSFVVLIGILFTPLFFGCNQEIKITLKTPPVVAYQINEDTGRELLVTEYNKYASSYVFGISTVRYDGENTDNFLKYEVEENYLDVTNIFKNARTYYFYAQYKGAGKYLDSQISTVSSQSITQKLDTPFLSLSNGNLSWSRIENATSYSVYSIINNRNNFITSTSATEYDVTNYINEKISEGLNSELKFFVYCNTSQNYIRSSDSNQVAYLAHLYLKSPSNLVISGTSTKILSWNVVNNAVNYTIKINNIVEKTVTSADFTIQSGKVRCDVTEFYDEYGLGDYEFCVKANSNGNFIESSYSNIVTDTYTEQLDTPKNLRCIDGNNQVEITWEIVQYARTYILEFSDTSNGYVTKQYVPNKGGVEGTIIHNSITLSYAELGITNIFTLRNSDFIVRVKAEGYGYYTDSNFSNGKSVISKEEILSAPKIFDNENENQLFWEAIDKARKYQISISHDNNIQNFLTIDTYFDYSNYLISAGTYELSCLAIASNEIYNSVSSNIITKDVLVQLNTPQITNVNVDGEYFVFSFDSDIKALTHKIYANGILIDEAFSSSNPRVLIQNVCDYAENDTLNITLRSNGNSYWTDSEISEPYSISTKLATPVITINGNILSWNSILNATSYILILDDKYIDLESTQNSVNLTNYIDLNTARQVIVQATNPYLTNSNLSSKLVYNRAQKNLNGYTNKYFYYGQTYDYYITDENELFDLLEYAFYNFIDEIEFYVDYDDSVSIKNKIDILDGGLTGTKNYQYQIMKNASRGTGETKLVFDHKSMSSPPTYTTTYTQYDGGMIYKGNGTRDNNHIFAADNYIVSQDVYSTDGLLSAIQNRAKPNFVETDSVAEAVYNKAKTILIEIIDDDMTDYQKALAIHDYLVTNIAYDTYGLNTISINNYLGYFHFIESALLYNLAVCDGYAKSFALLCNMEEIKCIVIDGSTDKTNPKETGHAWNKIYLDYDGNGICEWFAVDCTYDDAKSNNVEYLMHEYFMIPDTYLAQRKEDRETYPSATTDEAFYSYYKYNGVTLKIDSLAKLDAFKMYMLTHSNAKIEYLVDKDYYSVLGNYCKKAFEYTHDSDYYVCFSK